MKINVLVSFCLLPFVFGVETGDTERDARKLFGGYRITPRHCKPSREATSGNTGPTICMFNHECSTRNGEVVGACMDGFLFGACCQLREGAIGQLLDSSLDQGYLDDELYRPVPVKTPSANDIVIGGDITSSGLTHIAGTLLNEVLPTAQDNVIVQISNNQAFSTPGLTHQSQADTVLINDQNNYINPEEFKVKPNDGRKTTARIEQTTSTYKSSSPYIQISISNPGFSTPRPGFQRPVFKPKPTVASEDDEYVLIPTISHVTKPNKTQEFDSIVNIIQMLNQSTSYGSTQSYTLSTTRKPPSTSYVYSLTPTPRPGYTPSYAETSSKKPPSTSYVFSSTPPPRRPGYVPSTIIKKPSSAYPDTTKRPTKPIKTTVKKPATIYWNTATSIKPSNNYISSSTFRPAHSTFANSPEAFYTTSKKPPSTSYVYSPVITKKPPVSDPIPNYSISPSTSQYSNYPPPTVIVLGPVSSDSTTTSPVRKPVTQLTINNHVTHNIYGTSERPSPTVLITPKPNLSTRKPIRRPTTEYQPAELEIETSADDLINFPPVRNPNLNMSVPLLEDSDITTPTFLEDAALNNKVENFVNKIILNLQDPFNGLKDVVYDKNTTAFLEPTTKKPVKKEGTTKKPTVKPVSTNARPSTNKATTKKPIVTVTTKKPTTPKRTKPTKRVTTTPAVIEEQETPGAVDYRHECGVRPLTKRGRIVGGKSSEFGDFPWQVLVRESTWLGLFTKNKCGGVLLSNRYVMTAAHCQPGFLASLVAVLGEHDISGNKESMRPVSRNVKRVIVHRSYDAATFENDLALLELEHPVQFDQHIIPICLPRDGEDFTGRMATVSGWGRLKYGGGVPSILQEVQVPIMEKHVCQEMFRTAGHSKVILDSFLCAGYANGLKDSCEGDSGGPLVLQREDGRYQLAGTVSHGIKCAAPYLPGVYMRTTYYKPWIQSVTGLH